MSAQTAVLSLPPNASLEQLRKQAKDLRKACSQGDESAIARARAHLPRLANGDESVEVTLQEAQHILAKEYGFAKWEELTAGLDYDFARMAWLSDREAQVLLRETDQLDLVRALRGAPDEVRDKFLGNMSERVRRFIESEIEFLGDPESSLVTEARVRMEQQARQLAEQGTFTWPPPEPPEPGMPFTSRGLVTDLHTRPLRELPPEEVAEMIRDFAELARREGILALGPREGEIADPFVREGIRLIVDGTEPDLVRDVLETRGQTVVRNRQVRDRLTIEGILAIMAGDNPGIVRYKLETIYRDEPTDDSGVPRRVPRANQGEPVERMRLALGLERPSVRSLDQLTDLFTDLAFLARHQGVSAMGGLLDVIDEPLLAEGVRLAAVEQVSTEEVMESLERAAGQAVAELKRRHAMVATGVVGIQSDHKPADIAAACLAQAEGAPPTS